MELVKVDDKNKYADFLSKQNSVNLLQSWGWKEVLEGEDKDTQAFFVNDDGETISSFLVAKYIVPGGFVYLYSPRGPVFKNGLDPEQKTKVLRFTAEQLKNLYKDSLFWRIDPEEDISLPVIGFVKASKEMQPKASQVLDLTKTEDELMADMKQKTRYNVRLAEKRGVEIFEGKDQKDLDTFYNLLVETAGRDDFYLHEKEHYVNLWETLAPENLYVYLARFEENIIAGVMIGEYGGTAIYLHGASDYEHRSLMAPYLLQWHAIQQAKNRGNIIYDFHGVAPESAGDDHPWSGITRFKQGFGGEYVEHIGTWDYVYRPVMYKVFNIARSIARNK